MYFKKLELYGFKSFVEKTTLFFEPGVTAIVGPNGTGKSNISDAIKWVLGEQSAKSMRGSKMEDVIFNGTETRQPLNMAEVSLTLSNEEKILPIDYDEVTITRRLYRSGESEYLLNKTLVRLRDINELLMGTGIGTESYSLLEQGRIDAILSSRPEERRIVFEEASGITRYKKKKDEALRKLEATEENLLRINDIIVEVNRQLNSIARQVNKARRYQEQFEQLKAMDVQYTYREYTLLQKEKESLGNEENILRQEQSGLENELGGLSQSFNTIQSALAKVEQDYSCLNNALVSVGAQVEKNKDRIGLNKERIDECNQRVGALFAEIENTNKRIRECEEQLTQLRGRINIFQEEKKTKESNLNLKQAAIAEIEVSLKKAQELFEQCRVAAVTSLGEHARIKNELAKLSANIHNTQSRLLRLHQEKDKITQEMNEVCFTLESKSSELEQLKGKVTDEETQVFQLKKNYDRFGREIKELEEKIQEAKQTLIAYRSQLDVLDKLNREYEGFFSAVKALMLKKVEFPSAFDGVHDVLVNLIEVIPGYELCAETVLGDYLQAIVVDSRQVALRMRGFLEEQGIGRVRFLMLDSIPEFETLSCPLENTQKMSEIIRCKEQFARLIGYILRDTFLLKGTPKKIPVQELPDSAQTLVLAGKGPQKVNNGILFSYTAAHAHSVAVVGDFNNWVVSSEDKLERASENTWVKCFNLQPGRYCYKFIVDGQWIFDPCNPNKETDSSGNTNSFLEVMPDVLKKEISAPVYEDIKFSGRLVTMDAEMYSPVELVSKPVSGHVMGLISQKAQMRYLQEQCGDIEQAILQYQKEENSRREQLTLMEIELTQLSDILNNEKIVLANRDSERINIETSRKRLDEELSIVNLEIDETTLDEKELSVKEIEKKNRLLILEKESSVNEQKMAQSQELISVKTQEREELLVVIAEMKTEFSLLNEQEAALNNNFSILTENINRQNSSLDEYIRQKDEYIRRVEELTSAIEELEEKTVLLEREKQSVESSLAEIAIQRNKLFSDFEQIQNQIKVKENKLNHVKNNIRDVDVKKVEFNFKLEAIVNTARQSYKLELAALEMEIPADIDWNTQKAQIDILKDKIDRIGAVNLAAVEEEEELKERSDFLTSQKDDLCSAKQTLMQAIQKINKTTKELFLETFEKSKVTFREYFKLLFGGGDAQLHLTEDKDILESGIEIIIRPPGKKLQNIMLLSGGEKTLTAIALLFAVFKIKPTPFCVLDEMDAPLDESNIDRFTRVLQEFLKDSQFIIITHNKKTISMADVMYGVTMGEPGISKLVSVKFSEYKETSLALSASSQIETVPAFAGAKPQV